MLFVISSLGLCLRLLRLINQVAIRNFSYAVLHNEMFDSFASDYSFYRIGSFDSNTGIVKSCEPLPEFLLEASAVFRKGEKE